jgi:predicted ribosomally synthesized peptide with nif11-like leader
MSNSKVEEFLKQVSEDAALQGELAQALESDNDREAVTALANSKGYEFSSEELWAGIQARQAELTAQAAEADLSDAELEAVAGGVASTSTTTTYKPATTTAATGLYPYGVYAPTGTIGAGTTGPGNINSKVKW